MPKTKRAAKRGGRATTADDGSQGAPVGHLLRCLIATLARGPIGEDRLREIVGGKMSRAYNLCDGTRTIAEVARVAKKDAGNLSRSVARWVEAGAAFRLGAGTGARVLHAYPLPKGAGRRPGAGR